MNVDLAEALSESMRPHGEGVVDVDALRTAAVARGRAAKRRRMIVAAAGLTVLTAATMSIVPVLRGTQGGESAAGPGGRMLTMPPADAPGAAAAPDKVGADPGVFHFDVDLEGTSATGASWSIVDGVESARLWTSEFDHFNHEYEVTRDQSKLGAGSLGAPGAQPAETRQVTVAGRPATARFWPDLTSVNRVPDVPTWSVDWQPVDGLSARVRVFTSNPDDVIAAAEAMLLDRSQRCVAPLRLKRPPAVFTVVECRIDFGHIFPWTASDITLERADGVRFDVSIGRYSLGDGERFTPNLVVTGRPAMLTRNDGRPNRPNDVSVWIPITDEVVLTVLGGYRPTPVEADSGREHVPTADEEILGIANAITVGPNFTRPATWPTGVIG